MQIHLSGVAFHVLCVGLGFHVVIGVGRLVVRFHHAFVIPRFLLDVVVRLYLVIVNSDCSIAKTGSLSVVLALARDLGHGQQRVSRSITFLIFRARGTLTFITSLPRFF